METFRETTFRPRNKIYFDGPRLFYDDVCRLFKGLYLVMNESNYTRLSVKSTLLKKPNVTIRREYKLSNNSKRKHFTNFYTKLSKI